MNDINIGHLLTRIKKTYESCITLDQVFFASAYAEIYIDKYIEMLNKKITFKNNIPHENNNIYSYNNKLYSESLTRIKTDKNYVI